MTPRRALSRYNMIQGLYQSRIQTRLPKGKISTAFEEIRRALKGERLL